MKLAFYDARWAAAGTANGSAFDRAIEYDQWLRGYGAPSRFVHVEFVFDERRCRSRAPAVQAGDPGGALCYSSSPRDGGVRFKRIDLTDGKWSVFSLGTLPPLHLKLALDFCGARLGLRYDWLGIAGFVLPFGEHNDGDRFCSEAAVELMQRSAVKFLLSAASRGGDRAAGFVANVPGGVVSCANDRAGSGSALVAGEDSVKRSMNILTRIEQLLRSDPTPVEGLLGVMSIQLGAWIFLPRGAALLLHHVLGTMLIGLGVVRLIALLTNTHVLREAARVSFARGLGIGRHTDSTGSRLAGRTDLLQLCGGLHPGCCCVCGWARNAGRRRCGAIGYDVRQRRRGGIDYFDSGAGVEAALLAEGPRRRQDSGRGDRAAGSGRQVSGAHARVGGSQAGDGRADRQADVGHRRSAAGEEVLLAAVQSLMVCRAILLVEDNSADVELTRHMLSKSRIVNQLIVAADGQAALDSLSGAEDAALPALILLDLALPRLPGLEMLQRARSNARLRRIPVVVLTVSDTPADSSAADELAANAYIRKPVDQMPWRRWGATGWWSTMHRRRRCRCCNESRPLRKRTAVARQVRRGWVKSSGPPALSIVRESNFHVAGNSLK